MALKSTTKRTLVYSLRAETRRQSIALTEPQCSPLRRRAAGLNTFAALNLPRPLTEKALRVSVRGLQLSFSE